MKTNTIIKLTFLAVASGGIAFANVHALDTKGTPAASEPNITRREAGIPANVKGALVTEVAEATAAWEAELRVGDMIEQINHQPVASAEDAVKLTASPADRETLLRVWSHGGSHFLTIDETAEAK